MFKVNNRNTRTRCEICLKLTRKIPERYHISYMIYGTRYHISLTLNAITFSLFTLFCRNLSHISQTEYFPDSFSFTNKHIGIHFMSFNDWVFQWKMSFSPDANKQAQKVIFSLEIQKPAKPRLIFNNSIVTRSIPAQIQAVFHVSDSFSTRENRQPKN